VKSGKWNIIKFLKILCQERKFWHSKYKILRKKEMNKEKVREKNMSKEFWEIIKNEEEW